MPYGYAGVLTKMLGIMTGFIVPGFMIFIVGVLLEEFNKIATRRLFGVISGGAWLALWIIGINAVFTPITIGKILISIVMFPWIVASGIETVFQLGLGTLGGFPLNG